MSTVREPLRWVAVRSGKLAKIAGQIGHRAGHHGLAATVDETPALARAKLRPKAVSLRHRVDTGLQLFVRSFLGFDQLAHPYLLFARVSVAPLNDKVSLDQLVDRSLDFAMNSLTSLFTIAFDGGTPRCYPFVTIPIDETAGDRRCAILLELYVAEIGKDGRKRLSCGIVSTLFHDFPHVRTAPGLKPRVPSLRSGVRQARSWRTQGRMGNMAGPGRKLPDLIPDRQSALLTFPQALLGVAMHTAARKLAVAALTILAVLPCEAQSIFRPLDDPGALPVEEPQSDPMSFPDIKLTTSAISMENVGKALSLFRGACEPLFARHAVDVVRTRVYAGDDTLSPRAQRWAWRAEIQVEVVLRDGVTTFPPSARADGHTLWFIMGGGDKPGFQALKRASLTACGRTAYDEAEYEFVALPALARILPKSLPPTAEEKSWHAREVRNAWRGDYQGQRNVAYCFLTSCNRVSVIDIKMACAWRIVILSSGSLRVDSTDESNHRLECGMAERAGQLEAAKREAASIYRKVYRRDLR
jgi:hypothetical protein